MSLLRHRVQPLARALQSVLQQAGDLGLWLPFLIMAALEAVLLVGVARVDLFPSFLLAAFLQVLPSAAEHLRYPAVVLHLPALDRSVDVLLFVTAGAVLQGWAVLRLARAWTGRTVLLCPDARRGAARLLSLMALAGALVGAPFVVLRLAILLGQKDLAPVAALLCGIVAQLLLFAAPAYCVLLDLSAARSVAASVRLVGSLPVALPLAVLLLVALHVPGLMLRAPAIAAGAWHDPDWILGALLAQIPVDLCGAMLSAGLSAHFVLHAPVRRGAGADREARAVAATWTRGGTWASGKA